MSGDNFRAKAPGIMKRLIKEFDLDVTSAAAIMGNLGHESGGLADLQEEAPTVNGSRGGYGWAQWTGPRRRAFESWCEKNGLAPSSDKANLGYLIVELKGPEAAAIDAVKASGSLAEKVKAFELKFERAGVKHYPSRNTWAKIALEAWSAKFGKAPVKPKHVKVPPAPGEDPVYDQVQTIRNVQERLLALGYTEVGRADGSLGGMTKSAILLFREDNGLPLTATIDDKLILALATAPQRKLVPARENAPEKVVVEKVPEAKTAWYTKIGGYVVTALGAATAAVKGILENIPVVKDWVDPLTGFIGDMPGWAWGLVFASGGFALWYLGNRGLEKAKDAFRTGARR